MNIPLVLSRSRSRERYAERRTTRRSRSRSVSGSRSTQRSRSPSRSKKRRRSRSRSRSSDRLSKLGSRSKETSKTASPLSFKDVKESSTVAEERPRESLQEKMQRALEAAEILTQKEERDRQKKLASIEKDSFHIQQFHSSAQGANSAKAQQPMVGISRDWNHDSAIFTTNNISDLQNAARYLDSVQPKRNGKLASDFLSASREEKEARWFLKLQALRKQRLEGKPLSGRRKEEAGRNGR
ncbi:putative serine/arginine-rich splicing factor 4 [Apostichopus japonicus]|uniref:Putative serine/arginine-rich splicing factor 4 n=1 Tax=Stichopus japonicus TaxID=307972 RepID=A0A2G8LFC8_STIJA|nr:putative serine/arginine-rich splicing factor 4 [Apostichopus japonicus]